MRETNHARIVNKPRAWSTRPKVNPAPVRELPKSKLNLPANFEKFGTEEQDVIIEHERLKEREKDLKEIKNVYLEASRLRALRAFTDRDAEEMLEVERYTKNVLGGYAMKSKRTRVAHIRSNLKRRHEQHDLPKDDVIDRWYKRLLSDDRIQTVEDELEVANSKIEELKQQRTERNAKRHSKLHKTASTKTSVRTAKHSNKKRVSFQDDNEGLSASVKPVRQPKPRLSAAEQTENRRQVQYKLQDAHQAKIERQLGMFNSAGTEVKNGLSETRSTEAHHAQATRDAGESEESEEDDGQGLQYAPSQPATGLAATLTTTWPNPLEEVVAYDDREVEKLENERREQERKEGFGDASEKTVADAEPHYKGTQLPDQDLLARMQGRLQQGTHSAFQEVTVDTPEDDSGYDSEEEPTPILTYHIIGRFSNIESYDDEETYESDDILRLSQAERRTRLQIDMLKDKLSNSSQDMRFIEERINGLLQLRLEFWDGEESKGACRIWVEKHERTPTKMEWRSKRVRQAAKAKDVYVVDWEKTTTPKTNRVAPEQNDDDDLFGPDGHTTPEITIEQPGSDEGRYYTSLTMANTKAKQFYLDWYASFMPGIKNLGYVRQEDEALHTELDRLGGIGLFEREESFERFEGAKAVAAENLRVWVRKVCVLGPGN